MADLPVALVHAERNGGFAYGSNLGAAQGRAPYVLLLNPDATLAPDDLARLAAVLDAEPATGLVAPRIEDEHGGLHRSQRRFPRLRSALSKALFLHRVAPRAAWSDDLVHDAAAYGRPGTAEWVSGACLLVRRSALEALGGLDEGFFLYSEDTDLCARLWDAGWRVRFEPRPAPSTPAATRRRAAACAWPTSAATSATSSSTTGRAPRGSRPWPRRSRRSRTSLGPAPRRPGGRPATGPGSRPPSTPRRARTSGRAGRPAAVARAAVAAAGGRPAAAAA